MLDLGPRNPGEVWVKTSPGIRMLITRAEMQSLYMDVRQLLLIAAQLKISQGPIQAAWSEKLKKVVVVCREILGAFPNADPRL